jgi:hypothetical protein
MKLEVNIKKASTTGNIPDLEDIRNTLIQTFALSALSRDIVKNQ